MDVATVLRTARAPFADANPELPNGFAEHAPMGVDALLALGLEPDEVARWAARHQPVAPDPDGPVASRRRSVLDELAARPWESVVADHVDQLADRVDAHLFHGLIRTAHAVRALGRTVDDVALAELATGLAAWHAWAGEPDASGTAPRVDDAHGVVLDAARRGAGACASRPNIVNIHAVTAPMAFLLLADRLEPQTVDRACAAFGRTHARHAAPAASRRDVPPAAGDLSVLLDQWDAHPAKLAEAALRGFAVTGDGIFLDAVEAIMGPWPTTTPPGSMPPSSPHGSG